MSPSTPDQILRRIFYLSLYLVAGLGALVTFGIQGLGGAIFMGAIILILGALGIEGLLLGIRVTLWIVSLLDRLARALLRFEDPGPRHRRPPPVDPVFGPARPRHQGALRKVQFLTAGGAPAEAGSLEALAARARDTLDPLTRTPLLAGSEVAICRGQRGQCGTALPASLLPLLREEQAGQCPQCGTQDRFELAVIPAAAPAPAPTAALPLRSLREARA